MSQSWNINQLFFCMIQQDRLFIEILHYPSSWFVQCNLMVSSINHLIIINVAVIYCRFPSFIPGVVCSQPYIPSQGNLTNPETCDDSVKATPGTVCEYDCIRGYYLVGASSLICNNQGEWSQRFPRCQSKLTQFNFNIQNPVQMNISFWSLHTKAKMFEL